MKLFVRGTTPENSTQNIWSKYTNQRESAVAIQALPTLKIDLSKKTIPQYQLRGRHATSHSLLYAIVKKLYTEPLGIDPRFNETDRFRR
jgi:hypothetical protein